jgi:ABC-type branched-subunit amino acid transport system substrate-binding protein
LAGLTEAAAEDARRRGFAAVEAVGAETPAAQSADLVRRLAHVDASAILVLDSGGARQLLRQAQAQGWRPLVLLPSSLAGSSPGEDAISGMPPDLGERLFVSLPILPADWLAAEHRLPAHHAVVQRAALAATEVLIEGLKRAGREVSRDKLIVTLETLHRFDAGLGAPVTFGPNRRIGAHGAFVAAVDSAHPELGRQISWIDLAP